MLQPLVTGPDVIPVIVDEQNASQDPELAVLSAMAHGREDLAERIGRAALAAVHGLEAERVRLYVDLVLSFLSPAVRSVLEELMQSGKYEYQSEFARKYYSQGEAAALLEFLDARGIPISDEARTRIQACGDPAQLKRWLRRAATAGSIAELFEQ